MTLPSVFELARMIDHALLHPTTTDAEVEAGCALADRFETATVCVKPVHVPRAARALASSVVGVCSVVGFPHGNSHAAITALEAQRAIAEGATEIDMVVNTGHVLGGNLDQVARDVAELQATSARGGAILKVIFEIDFLADAHVVALCRLCSDAGVAFVKTSTGYGFVKQPQGGYDTRGATEARVKLMRDECSPAVAIKAAGGIRTLDDLLRFRACGASRFGASATESILTEALRRGHPPGSPRLAALSTAAVAPGTSTGY